MKWQLKVFDCLCETEVFQINGVDADWEDFGEKCDTQRTLAQPYACADMQFTRVPATPEILKKYKIDKDEYNMVCEALEEKLSFGRCGWCV